MRERIAVLTVSDSRTTDDDGSGDAVAAWAVGRGAMVTARALVRDSTLAISAQLVAWCDADVADVVFTTGGTGLAPRDVTPEATRAVLERDAPGLAERIRATSMERFPRAALSRGIAGTRGETLIVNLPGSTGGVRDALDALEPILTHAVRVLRDWPTDHSHGAGTAPVTADREAAA